MKKSLLTITDNAVKQMKSLLSSQNEAIGFRLSTSSKGCNGVSYDMQYMTNTNNKEEVFMTNDIKIAVPNKSLMYVIGTNIDYKTTQFGDEFVFNNPNSKGCCGCGKSFNI